MDLELREQVFVSSTYLDLKDERQEVIQTLLEANCFPAGMELFPATDFDRWTLIQREIRDSDYYLVIVGGRYGSVDAQHGLSYTEMEFDYAVQLGKPVMGFLHGSPGSIVAEKTELDPEKRKALEAFRSKVEERIVRYWETPSDLGGQVAKSLIKIRQSHPAEGWVRARSAITPELESELAGLRIRVRELEAELRDQQSAASAMAVELSQGDELYELGTTLKYWSKDDVASGRDKEWREKPRRRGLPIPVTWNRILVAVGTRMLVEASTDEVEDALTDLAAETFFEDGLAPTNYQTGVSIEVSDETVREVLLQLHALGMLSETSKKHIPSDTAQYWQLTPEGKAQVMRLGTIPPTKKAAAAVPEKKATAKKATAKKATAKKATAKKATVKKATVKKATVKKATVKKATVKKATVKKATVKKATVKKATT